MSDRSKENFSLDPDQQQLHSISDIYQMVDMPIMQRAQLQAEIVAAKKSLSKLRQKWQRELIIERVVYTFFNLITLCFEFHPLDDEPYYNQTMINREVERQRKEFRIPEKEQKMKDSSFLAN